MSSLEDFANGKIIDQGYTLTAKEIGYSSDRVAGDDFTQFRIGNIRFMISGFGRRACATSGRWPGERMVLSC